MKIIHVNTLRKKGGGAAKVAERLMLSQKKEGHTVRWYSSEDKDKFLFSKYIQPLINHVIIDPLDLYDVFNSFSLEIMTQNQVKNADIIHLHNLHGNYFGLSALPMLVKNKNVIWTFHDMWALTGHCCHAFDCIGYKERECRKCPYLNVEVELKRDIAHQILLLKKWIYNHSKFEIVVPSLWLKEKVESSILNNKSIHYIPNGINHKVFYKMDKKECRAKLGLPQDKIILMFSANVGSNNKWKGTKYIWEAIKFLRKSPLKEKILFLDVGGERRIANDYYGSGYVASEKKMVQYYSSADIFIYPTLADNAPLVVLEAMACGLPVVTFDTGGVPELVSHMECGYIAKYKDNSEFIKGVHLLIEDENIRANFAMRSTKRVLENFTLDKMSDKYMDLYTTTIYEAIERGGHYE